MDYSAFLCISSNGDSDGDGVPDGQEVEDGSDPRDARDEGKPPEQQECQQTARIKLTGKSVL